MKNIQKIVVVLVMFLLVFSLNSYINAEATIRLTQASSSDGSSSPAVTIQWWTPNWDEPESREMVSEFEANNPDIKIDLVITDWNTYKEKITTALTGRNVPELYTVLLTDVRPFAKLGLLESLNILGEEAGIDFPDFVQPALEITSVDDAIFGVPFRYDGSGIYYNIDILKEAGYDSFPTTWDEMILMSAKLKDLGYTPFAWPLGQQANAVTRLVQQLYTYGGSVLAEDQKTCLLNSDAAKTALSKIKETLDMGYASSSSMEIDNTIMRNMFGTGQIAFNFSGPFDIDTLLTDYPNLDFATAVIPGIDGMGPTTANGWGIVMSSGSKNKEAAARFLSYITTPENQARLTDSFPASYTALKYEKFASDYLKPFATQLDNSREEPSYDRWLEIEPIIYQYMQYALAGTMSVDEACEGMTKDINSLLAF